jgi:pyruvate/2-oxoglutarate dehydrogenase complex dihydrolipoamide acyltransferase (E2) component
MGKTFDLVIPTLNVNDNKVTIGSIQKQNLEYIEKGEMLYSVESSKAVEDYEAEMSGFVVLYIEDIDEVEFGKSAGMIFEDLEEAKAKNEEIIAAKEKAKKMASINASKKAIAYAEQLGFDITLIKKNGIIKTEDIDNFISSNK